MSTNFVPTRETELLGFSENFSTKITAGAASYGLTPAMATAFSDLNRAFADAMTLLEDPVTRSPHYVEQKNLAKEALIDGPGGIRELAALVQATPSVTDLQRIDLRLTVRDHENTPVEPPSLAPDLSIKSIVDRTVTLQLRDAENRDSRARPVGANGATILYYTGDTTPGHELQWHFLMNTSKTEEEIDFPTSVGVGTKIWLTAFWFNQRKESSPITTPINFRLSDGLLNAAA